ncbi:MAG: HlyD family efflux transporter periplasmic adaptor subunit [Algoriphagus sp.]|jgi:HlyD family secretion protein|uniref:efflux RND transporter periplasmic adaptor subunit n=1 Tax=Algoriphagus sp. TaxID=1872435 RepID=UPI00271BE3EF|nr:HlyD family efflux transporter periplasmic adaptor subunit [Algoriphagus sp.]MDO8966738.1 HlyD family efflux transporter periplasmic adaptor subunit [Algoriphagus sp.]MDP3199939.1 HlyD family efflux transporter periplasmic adaptor subunit [Algoriphagus sp.]MDP3473869.1 HlyD family efflux transporter periplasmic adaptor subunit [Algoriphagus sp.]
MDRKIEKKTWTLKRIAAVIGGAVLVGGIIYQIGYADHRSTMNVDKDRLSIATVSKGEFTDYILVSGQIEPARTVFLDAIEGGMVNQVIRESGALLKKGDTILVLNNSNLQLDVMQRETMLYEQINNLRQTRLLLDQNDLNQQGQLAEIDYQISLLKPQYERFKQLHEKKLVSDREFEEVKEQYEYNVKRKKLTYTSYRNDSIARSFQLSQLRQSEGRMNASLNGVGNILNNLVITAPIAGQLATPQQLEIGQAINPGQRYGQIDILDEFKVRVPIDELYLPRIGQGLRGKFTLSGQDYELEITKIYPTITNGRFEVDMAFTGENPAGIRRGQSVRIRLELGQSEQSMLLPTGGFFKDTGGNWVFVLNAAGNAERRNIRLGRKNPEFYEVLEGLVEGEKVIVSGYENFGNNEVLELR